MWENTNMNVYHGIMIIERKVFESNKESVNDSKGSRRIEGRGILTNEWSDVVRPSMLGPAPVPRFWWRVPEGPLRTVGLGNWPPTSHNGRRRAAPSCDKLATWEVRFPQVMFPRAVSISAPPRRRIYVGDAVLQLASHRQNRCTRPARPRRPTAIESVIAEAEALENGNDPPENASSSHSGPVSFGCRRLFCSFLSQLCRRLCASSAWLSSPLPVRISSHRPGGSYLISSTSSFRLQELHWCANSSIQYAVSH